MIDSSIFLNSNFLFGTLSLVFLLITSAFVYILSKKIHFQYTILLVLVGVLLVPLSKIGFLGFIDDFKLTPNILFFIFLPVLLFEASYNINYRHFAKNWKTIGFLSTFGVLISSFIIAILLYVSFKFIGLDINFLICFLFGSLISATDPVAVLSIFKDIGAPKRLTLIFEGESLFNDGTSVVLFMIILGTILQGGYFSSEIFIIGLYSFTTMILGGILFGAFTGVVFSKLIGKINYNEEAEITLALISAYTTFILAELITHSFIYLPLSGIIATVVSSMIIGNYGRYKITPKSELHMERFLGFFTFISNSIVFILMGLIFSQINVDFKLLIKPIIITILIVMITRAITVYFSIGITNALNVEKKIPFSWQKLLFWGGLKGVLALMMVLMIPGEGSVGYEAIKTFETNIGWNLPYSFKDFLAVLTISTIMFTLFIKAPTIGIIIRRMGLDKIYDFEKIEYSEWKIIANLKILEKLEKFYKDNYLSKKEYGKLKNKYKTDLKETIESLNSALEGNKEEELALFTKRLIFKYALGIEKSYLKKMYNYKKIDEKNFKYILEDIEGHIQKLNIELKNKTNIHSFKRNTNLLETIVSLFKQKYSDSDMYIINRTKYTIGKKVIKDLKNFPSDEYLFDKKTIQEIISMYQMNGEFENKKRKEIYKGNKNIITHLESDILNKTFLKLEEKILKDLQSKEILPPKLYRDYMSKLEKDLYSDVEFKEIETD